MFCLLEFGPSLALPTPDKYLDSCRVFWSELWRSRLPQCSSFRVQKLILVFDPWFGFFFDTTVDDAVCCGVGAWLV